MHTYAESMHQIQQYALYNFLASNHNNLKQAVMLSQMHLNGQPRKFKTQGT